MLQLIIDLASQAERSIYGQMLLEATFIGFVLLYSFIRSLPRLHPGIPAWGINEKGWMRYEKARARYMRQGKKIVEEGMKTLNKPFQVVTDVGVKIFLPYRYAEEIKNVPGLTFSESVKKEGFIGLPGTQPFGYVGSSVNIIQLVVRQNITPSLNLITNDIAEECGFALEEMLGDTTEAWTPIVLKPFILDLVARLSSRLFVGTELCRNEEWLWLVKQYTIDAFVATRRLRAMPFALRWLGIILLPEWRKIRQEVADARRILAPVIEKRLKERPAEDEKGEKRTKVKDTIGWFHDAFERNGVKGNIADIQLGLSVVAIATTTELLGGVLLDLAQNKEFINELRQEMIDVLGTKACIDEKTGRIRWEKKTIYQLKLLDSALKESQRLHVRDVASMRRGADTEVRLSDGTVIPKGALIMVTLEGFRDPKLYPNPDEYQPRRFLNMRNLPGQENKWQLVSTSAEHLGFGHGEHACPGRFFASNEVKIALIHLLMKYDWILPFGKRSEDVVKAGSEQGLDHQAKILYRRRKEEILL